MKKTWGFRIIVGVFLITTFTIGYANMGFAAPSGSYTKTCINIQSDDTNITKAECKRLDGTTNKNASLNNWSDCTGDRENCNGNLRCTGVDLPAGNYRNSSFCCYKKYKLDTYAQREVENVCCLCKQSNGKYNPSETCTPTSCASPKQIQNMNGTLTCQ